MFWILSEEQKVKFDIGTLGFDLIELSLEKVTPIKKPFI